MALARMVGLEVMPRTPIETNSASVPVLEPVAAQVVQPRALATDVVQVVETGHLGSSLLMSLARS